MCLHALCTCTFFNYCIRGEFVCVEPCYINLLFLYRFEAIFNRHINATYTIDTEPMWHHMLDKECMGSHPKMFLFALDELSYIYQCINNTDAQHIIVYEILSFASDRCIEQCNRSLKPERDTFGPAMPHVNLGDIGNLKRLAWAVYNEMYVPGSWPALSGLANWACILNKVMTHIFHGRMLQEHCPPKHHWRDQCGCCCPLKRGPSGEAVWEKEPAEETPSTVGTSLPCLQDTNTLVNHKCDIKGPPQHVLMVEQ